MNAARLPAPSVTEFDSPILALHHWLRERNYAGHEPYDLLNSPLLRKWAVHQPFATLFIQGGKRIGGVHLRQWLHVPPSHNPKALALVLSAFCDLARSGWFSRRHAEHVRNLLLELRSPHESDFCWGYDWHYVSLRGARMPAFSPNSVVTVFCAHALLDFANIYQDEESKAIAHSATNWLATRLNRSTDTDTGLCLSYTPNDHTRIFNNSALAGALFARIASDSRLPQYGSLARRIMEYLGNGQAKDGSWTYGVARSQQWIDTFHTGYNLCALLEYQQLTGDTSFSQALARGYDFYCSHFFCPDGAPRYFHNRTYPIDIHSCSQAILTLCAFAELDPDALSRAEQIARWTIQHLRNSDGSFGYQIHPHRVDRTPYIRWSQAWMLRALARLRLTIGGE
ncbi:conserved hypothetical protein [Candidatus Koribacter versatilis Ellin345]|uniref:Delta-aminolevulinic acid dehydratase n=1 Tax=Koribacter versatilis (strain Ellin345) TaxID=204669 RepID=Q1ING0_KORVE|nr:hypothetical protein [Candidatus Koribacter versatilis]ABF41590.1 conserved hypothetical protein [Candidatus Koribacter versatilis Ellin345]